MLKRINNHFEVREYLNKFGAKATVAELKSLLSHVENISKVYTFGFQKELFQDLMDDIENEIDIRKSITTSDDVRPVTNKNSVLTIRPSLEVDIVIFSDKPISLLREVEKEVIRIALLKCEGNRTKTAKFLGMSIRTLRNKINEYLESGEICEVELPGICKESQELIRASGSVSSQDSPNGLRSL